MSSSDGKREPSGGLSLLSKAGKLSLSNNSHNTLLQQVQDDDEFPPVGHITTSYLPTSEDPNVPNTPIKHSPPNSNIRGTKDRIKKETGRDSMEIDQLTSLLRSNANAERKNVERKKKQKLNRFMDKAEDEDLGGVQQIISQIQAIVSHSQEIKDLGFKQIAQPSKRKRQPWTGKSINKFPQKNEGFSKLEALLLDYPIEQKNAVLPVQPQSYEKASNISDRRRRQQQRLKRNRDYQQAQKQLQQVSQNVQKQELEVEGEKEVRMQGEGEEMQIQKAAQVEIQKQAEQSNAQYQQSRNEYSEPFQGEQEPLKLEDIDFIQIQWNKLPITLSPITPQNSELLLRMRDYPDDNSFLQALNQMADQSHYTCYSVFDPKRNAGLKDGMLQSEEEFRQTWAEQWSYEVEEESTKQMLCQFDFQWYRSLVQLTYSHPLQQILIKEIKYDPNLYIKNLRKINGGTDDKNLSTDDLTIINRATLNKLKFIDHLLSMFYKQVLTQGPRHVVVGVVPSIPLLYSQQDILKEYIQTLFIGGIYDTHNEAAMGVLVPLQQATANKVERVASGLVKMGKVTLAINQQKPEEGSYILLRSERSKNSQINLTVGQPGKEEMVLEVGEQLHCGRRYRIDLD